MTGGIGGLGEFGLIREWTQQLKTNESVQQGIGDDCAIIAGCPDMLLTCDASLEDIHFKRHWGTPEDIGWKAAVSALSDIAAMGGRARFVLVTVALPDDVDRAYVGALYRGLTLAVESAGAVIVGGDTTTSRSGIVLDIMVVGEVVGRPVLRRGARPGDVVAATGVIGERGAGLNALLHDIPAPELIRAYLHPTPRLAEGQWLQAQVGVQAMMDISDGLLPDARHIATASGVGIDFDPGKLVPSAPLEAFWKAQGRDAALARLCSGEEYELLVVLDAAHAEDTCRAFAHQFALPLTVLGRCTEKTGPVLVDGKIPAASGFEHFQQE